MFVKTSLVFGFAFLGAYMVSGNWRQFRSHRRAPGGSNGATLRLLPLLGFDKIIAKYALGLQTTTAFDGAPVDLAEGYYEIFEVTEDADLASSQFTQSTVLVFLTKQNECKTVMVNRLMIVTIVDALQKGLQPAIENLQSTIQDLLEDLPADIKGPLFDRIQIALDASLLQSSISGIVGRSFPIEAAKELKNTIASIMLNSTSKDNFENILGTIPIFKSTDPICPTMMDLELTYMGEIPNIKKAFSANILQSIAMVRGELGLKRIEMDDIKYMEQLFKALNPIVGNVIDGILARMKSGSPEDLRLFLNEFSDYNFELPNPMTGTIPSGPSVFEDIKAKISMLIDAEGPLKEFVRADRSKDGRIKEIILYIKFIYRTHFIVCVLAFSHSY